MSQQFYNEYIQKWNEEHKWKLATKVIYDVSSNIGNGWEYLPKPYADEMLARIMAQSLSASSKRGVEELWRVSRGNVTVALFLNGEEVREDD